MHALQVLANLILNSPPFKKIVICNQAQKLIATEKLAGDLDCDFYTECDPKAFSPDHIALLFDAAGTSLQLCGRKAPGPVRADFVAGKLGYRRQQKDHNKTDIAKAVGWQGSNPPSVLDVTAGLGQDAFVLADLGCPVTLVERNLMITALLMDGVQRARQFARDSEPALLDTLERMQVVMMDSREYLLGLDEDARPDVIYLDPMFPPRGKSAKVNKNMQAFHAIVGTDEDSEALLELALQKAQYRVVVKRPVHAEFLGGRQPPLQFSGRSVRFDTFPLRKRL